MKGQRPIAMYNAFMQKNPNLIHKALTSASGVGQALIPENLEKIITDTVIRLSPELAMIEAKDSGGAKTHEFDRLTERPAVGGAMGENATTPVTNSKTERATVDLKIVRRKGKVTNFLKDTSRKFIDAAAWEMQNHLQAHVIDLIHYLYYGNANMKTIINSVIEQSDTYEFNGLDRFIATNRVEKGRGGVVPTSLKELDDMIDASNRKGGAKHRRAFMMTPEMLSKFSGLLTNVRLNQGLSGNGITQVSVNGGWRLNAYRDIPIIESTSMGPIEIMKPTVTLSTVGTGGALSNGTYYVQIAPVTPEGEQEAKAEQSITLSAGTATQLIRISLSAAHSDANSVENVYKYKVYVSTSSGAETLNKIVPAFVYDSAGAPTTGNGVGTNYINITSTTADASVPSHMQSDVPLVATGGVRPEVIALWDMDPIQGLGKVPYTNSSGSTFNGLVTTQPLATTDDFLQFLVKSYCALADSYEVTSVWKRNLRTA